MSWGEETISAVKERVSGGENIFGGEYDYFAQHGRLLGVNQISLGVYIPRIEVEHVYFKVPPNFSK